MRLSIAFVLLFVIVSFGESDAGEQVKEKAEAAVDVKSKGKGDVDAAAKAEVSYEKSGHNSKGDKSKGEKSKGHESKGEKSKGHKSKGEKSKGHGSKGDKSKGHGSKGDKSSGSKGCTKPKGNPCDCVCSCKEVLPKKICKGSKIPPPVKTEPIRTSSAITCTTTSYEIPFLHRR